MSVSPKSQPAVRGASARGRGRGRGGFVPKPAVLEAMRARAKVSTSEEPHPKLSEELDVVAPSQSTQKSDGAEKLSKKYPGIVESSDDDDVPRCDLCCEPNHRARNCPIFQPKTVGYKPPDDIMCYYCRKVGHKKSDCPVKNQQRNNSGRHDNNGSSKNFGRLSQNKNHDFSEKKAEGSGSGVGAMNGGKGNNWSVVKQRAGSSKGGREFSKGARKNSNFAQVPMPTPASNLKPDLQLRPQFANSANAPLQLPPPELKPRSKIEYNRSDSEDYKSGDEEEDEKKVEGVAIEKKPESETAEKKEVESETQDGLPSETTALKELESEKQDEPSAGTADNEEEVCGKQDGPVAETTEKKEEESEKTEIDLSEEPVVETTEKKDFETNGQTNEQDAEAGSLGKKVIGVETLDKEAEDEVDSLSDNEVIRGAKDAEIQYYDLTSEDSGKDSNEEGKPAIADEEYGVDGAVAALSSEEFGDEAVDDSDID